MKSLTLQDPKTFDLPNKEKVKNVIKLFQSEDKEQFINSYQELNNTDKFYAVATCVYYFTDVKMARQMFLEELREDLRTLKLLNKPKGKDLQFGYEYKGYSYDKAIMDRISLSYFEVK
jgi:hypothetical protein